MKSLLEKAPQSISSRGKREKLVFRSARRKLEEALFQHSKARKMWFKSVDEDLWLSYARQYQQKNKQMFLFLFCWLRITHAEINATFRADKM